MLKSLTIIKIELIPASKIKENWTTGKIQLIEVQTNEGEYIRLIDNAPQSCYLDTTFFRNNVRRLGKEWKVGEKYFFNKDFEILAGSREYFFDWLKAFEG